MVNPIGPIDESQNIAPADLSAMGMEASGATRSQEAQDIANIDTAKTTKPTPNTIREWRSFSAAKQAISSLMDKVANIFSKPPVTNSSPATTFDEAKQNMEAAKLQLQSATNMTEFKSALQALQTSVQQMDALADPSQKAEVDTLKAALASKQPTIDQILELDSALTELDQLLQELQTTSSMNKVNEIKGKIEESRQQVKEILDKLTAAGVTSPVIDDTKASIESMQSQLLQLATALQSVYDAGKGSLSAVESAKNNNSLANINASKEIIDNAKQVLDQILLLAPNSPIVKKAQQEINKAAQVIDTIEPSGGSSVSGGASVSTSQNQGKNISEQRLALQLDDVDNTSVAMMMQGFRSMINGFYNQSNEMQQESGDFSQEVESSLQGLSEEYPGAENELQQLEDTLFNSEGSSQIDLANALASIALASVKLGGGTSVQAAQVGSDVKQLYNSSNSSSFSKVDSLKSGYQSWKRLNSTYSSEGEAVRNVLNQTMSPALSTVIPRGDSSRNVSTHEGLSRDVAQSIVRNSRTLGDVYQSLQIFEQALDQTRQTGDASRSQPKLTEDITKPPGFGYPYMQLSSQAEQKFMAELEEAFINGSRELAEKKEAEFTTNTQYIQQVLTNVASLFAAYLQN